MLRHLALLLLSSPAFAVQPRDFRVPPVDFTQLSGATNNSHNLDLLVKFQENGIVALQNVPNFATLRRQYLQLAATCAVEAQKKEATFLLHRQLRDKTNRYTVSLESGRQLLASLAQNAELGTMCPEFVAIHATFSAVVELAVANVASALDATPHFRVVVEEGAVVMTARNLLEDSVHIDHFHAYEAPANTPHQKKDSFFDVAELSLELHTDSGLMIAMAAPAYFELSSTGRLVPKATEGRDAGLYIQTATGEVVRPILESDELLLMLGSGIEDWIETSPPLRSVLHGMQYPRAVSTVGKDGNQGPPVFRSWFGKMILLPAHQQMKNTGSTFGHYANQTVRYLMQHENQNTVFSVACPPHRHLEASSVGTCLVKTCSLKSTSSSSDLKASCPITCNHVAPADVALCSKHCDCIDETKPGTTCWMLCVENLATDVCPGEQKCNTGPSREQLAMTCPGGLISSPSVAPLSPATAPLSPATAPLSPATAPLTTSINNSMTSPATTLNAGTMKTAPLSPVTETTVTETTVLETTVPDPTESGGDNLSPNVSTNAKVIPDANEADSMTGPLDPEDGPSDTISLAPRSNSGAMLLTSVAVLGAVIGCM